MTGETFSAGREVLSWLNDCLVLVVGSVCFWASVSTRTRGDLLFLQMLLVAYSAPGTGVPQ